jgi:hypothetical protein
LSWTHIADLFRAEDRFGGSTHPEAFGFVLDPADRKFAALADAAQAPLVTSDAGLLNAGRQMAVPVLKPSEFRPPLWCAGREARRFERKRWIWPVLPAAPAAGKRSATAGMTSRPITSIGWISSHADH